MYNTHTHLSCVPLYLKVKLTVANLGANGYFDTCVHEMCLLALIDSYKGI